MAILSAGLLVIGLTLVAPPARALTTPAIPWDLNGDGYAELAIGAWGEKHRPDGSPTLLLEVGRVTLFRGTATGPTTTGIRKISTWVTPGEFAYFGRALTSCDFDADGYADMAIGALGLANPGNTDSRGTVNVMYGSATGPVDAGRQVLRALDFGRGGTWGGPLACGDLNEDGFADLAIGVNTCCDQPQWVTVIYGSSSGLDVDEFVHLDELDAVGGDPADVRGGYGRSVTIGDLDNDGADDLVVGANAGGPFSGVFAHYGDDGGIASEATTIIRPDTPELINSFPNSEWNEIGHETAIGDFNGDGDGDLAIGGGWRLTGCERENSDLPCPGLVAVIPTTAIGLNLGSVKVWHPGTSGVAGQTQATYDRFGTALASGRLNSDSRDDLAIGAPYKNVGATLAGGGVTVLYGSSTGLTATNSQIWVQSSPGVPGIDEPGDLFGSDLLISRLRGSNGSGLSIGINNEDVGQADNAGAVTVLLSESGGLSATGSKTWSESSPGVPGLAVEGDHFNTVS